MADAPAPTSPLTSPPPPTSVAGPAASSPSANTREQPVAGPSRVAPHRHLPKLAYGAIEYPGPVSHTSAILNVTSQREINDCFNAPPTDNALLEINYRTDKSGGPIRGYRVPSQKLLVKVVKRRRKDGQGGVFTSEVVGPVSQTVRFRSMADWHWTPNPDGPTQDLLATLKNLDYDGILEYKIPDLHEEYTIPTSPELGKEPDPELSHRSLLDLQPVPIFSERRLPLVYNYRQTHASAVMEYQDPITGEIKQRLHNTSRVHGFAPITIGHHHPLGEVPKDPEPKIKGKIPKLNKDLLDKMKRIFEERPVWMRSGLLAQFTAEERHIIVESKSYIPACAYMFGAGPYWKCYSRFGYDPRQHPEAKIYQRTYFYITAARSNAKPIFDTPEPGEEDEEPIADKTAHEAWAEAQARRIEAGEREPLDKSREHIFDGRVLNRDRPDYQLCDITDPLIKKYIDDPRIVTETCDPRSGWYTPTGMEMIREMIKAKYVWVRDRNEPAPDRECYRFIEMLEGSVQEEPGKDKDAQQSGDDVDMAEQ